MLYSAIHVGIPILYPGKYVTEDKSRTDTTKTKLKQQKANNTKHNKNKTSLV